MGPGIRREDGAEEVGDSRGGRGGRHLPRIGRVELRHQNCDLRGRRMDGHRREVRPLQV